MSRPTVLTDITDCCVYGCFCLEALMVFMLKSDSQLEKNWIIV